MLVLLYACHTQRLRYVSAYQIVHILAYIILPIKLNAEKYATVYKTIKKTRKRESKSKLVKDQRLHIPKVGSRLGVAAKDVLTHMLIPTSPESISRIHSQLYFYLIRVFSVHDCFNSFYTLDKAENAEGLHIYISKISTLLYSPHVYVRMQRAHCAGPRTRDIVKIKKK